MTYISDDEEAARQARVEQAAMDVVDTEQSGKSTKEAIQVLKTALQDMRSLVTGGEMAEAWLKASHASQDCDGMRTAIGILFLYKIRDDIERRYSYGTSKDEDDWTRGHRFAITKVLERINMRIQQTEENND